MHQDPDEVQAELLRIADSLRLRIKDISAFPTEYRKLLYLSSTLKETVKALKRVDMLLP